jgi:hypothetical protein
MSSPERRAAEVVRSEGTPEIRIVKDVKNKVNNSMLWIRIGPCGYGSGFLSQCGSGFRGLNQCRSIRIRILARL